MLHVDFWSIFTQCTYPHTTTLLGHILTKLELQALSTFLATYSDERLEEIKVTIQEQQKIKDISREEVEGLLRQYGLSSMADVLENHIENGIYVFSYQGFIQDF